MQNKITKIVKVSAGTAKDVDIGYRTFLIQNVGDADAYFKAKEQDGKAVTSATGFVLAAGASTVFPMTAKTLSVLGSDIRILMME